MYICIRYVIIQNQKEITLTCGIPVTLTTRNNVSFACKQNIVKSYLLTILCNYQEPDKIASTGRSGQTSTWTTSLWKEQKLDSGDRLHWSRKAVLAGLCSPLVKHYIADTNIKPPLALTKHFWRVKQLQQPTPTLRFISRKATIGISLVQQLKAETEEERQLNIFIAFKCTKCLICIKVVFLTTILGGTWG